MITQRSLSLRGAELRSPLPSGKRSPRLFGVLVMVCLLAGCLADTPHQPSNIIGGGDNASAEANSDRPAAMGGDMSPGGTTGMASNNSNTGATSNTATSNNSNTGTTSNTATSNNSNTTTSNTATSNTSTSNTSTSNTSTSNTSTGGGDVGVACSDHGACEGGFCLSEESGFPEGYCSMASCSQDSCPDGSSCWEFQSGESYCLRNCELNSDCRSGYFCDGDSTCWPGSSPTGGASGIGDACSTSADCRDSGAECYPAVYNGEDTGFVGGYCIRFDCGEDAPCPAGSACYNLSNGGTACFDSCQQTSECRDGYACDSDACLPGCTENSCPEGYICGEDGSCVVEPCTAGSCPNGQVCEAGICVLDIGDAPAGPIPSCNDLPEYECAGSSTWCAELIPFEPVNGPGYENYPINGETASNQYRSYLRRDVVMMLKYASARTDCLASGWDFGNGGPIGLGDMSEADGAIPGTSINRPGHPEGTHVDGFDIDIAYYQINTANNRLRPVCDHLENGQDAYRCVSAPYLMDPWRTALFFGALYETGRVRVIGVDGQTGPILESAIDQLCSQGWLTPAACRAVSLAYEVVNENRGWYYFHHHHFHASFSAPANKGELVDATEACLLEGCPEVDGEQIHHDLEPLRHAPLVLPGAWWHHIVPQ